MKNGNFIKELFAEGKITDNDLKLFFNTDGAPIFKSSNRSVWPLQGKIIELGDEIRNKFLLGVHFYHRKPEIFTFFQPFLKEMDELGTDGFKWCNREGQQIVSRVYVLCCCCDNPARTLIHFTIQYNGKNGCDWCTDDGLRIPKGRGHARVYLPNEERVFRDHETFKQDALRATPDHPVNGIKGPSPFLLLRNFDIVRGILPDYLHCFLLGITKMFMNLFFDSSHHGRRGIWVYVSNILTENYSEFALLLRYRGRRGV